MTGAAALLLACSAAFWAAGQGSAAAAEPAQNPERLREAGNASRTCSESDRYARMDFWVGTWQVRVDGRLVGTNRIEKTLNGCAIEEHWSALTGSHGMSLFYVDDEGVWRQVWVTDTATRPGGVKEKVLIPAPSSDSVRFQGQVGSSDGKSYLDRTTLLQLTDGRVRQVIEVSTDGGETWQTVFDAIYERCANCADGDEGRDTGAAHGS